MRLGAPRLGLRARLSLFQGLLALVICGAMAVAVWLVVADVLVDRNRAEARAHAVASAQALSGGLGERGAAPPEELLRRIARPEGTQLVLWHQGTWSTTSETDVRELRPSLAALVRPGSPRDERLEVAGEEVNVVAVPLPSAGGYYFELSSTEDLDRTVRLLGLVLLVGALALAAVAAVLGWIAGSRALRPLAVVSRAASAAAAGQPHARLDAEDDPDLGELARSFNSTTEALRHRVRADARFAADVSHELRTPLTTMLNSMEVVEAQREQLPPRVRDAVALLAAELKGFHGLVLDLLEVSRAESTEHSLLEPTRVAEAVRHAADEAAGREVARVEPDADDVVLELDRRRIERIVGNLVRNADQHGEGCVAVTVSATPTSVAICVDDAGPGIAPERRSRVMERFVTTSTREQGGSGLGLPIVDAHVRALRGRLRIEDRPGGGARVVVTLPRGSST